MTDESQKYPYESLEPIPLIYGGIGIVITVIFFSIINRVVSVIGPPKSVETDAWRWTNLFISWIHAFITGSWDLLCFILYPEMLTDLIAFHNSFIYGMVVFSTGYFFYDFLDIVTKGKVKASWEVVLHHIFVAGIFFYNIILCRCIPYTAVALLAEVNSFFLHSRKLMQMSKVDYAHPLYRINVWINLVVFVFGRFGGLVWIFYGMFMWNERMDTAYICFLSSSMFVMCFINVILFYRLIKNDVLRPYSTTRATPKARPAAGQPDYKPLSNGTHSNCDSSIGKLSHSNNNFKENGFISNGVHSRKIL